MENKQKQVDAASIPFDKNLPTALFVIRDKGGCGFYRCLQPALHLRSRQLINTITDFKVTTREHILQADIIIFQEAGSPQAMEAMNFAIANKKPVVVECDDFLHHVSPNNIAGYGAWNTGTLFLHRFVQMMFKATAMIVATPQLAREYAPYNKNIFVLPNFLNENKWDNPQTKKMDGYLRVGWCGGNAHGDDLKMIAKVIEKIIHEHKDKVKFETMGMLKGELGNTFNSLEEFGSVCPKCNYQGDSVTYAGESLDNYPLVLASHGWDIAVAPVINNSFGNCKSDLKLKEYSAVGYPIVASDVVPYREAKELGCDVLLAKNFNEWYNNLEELIGNPERRDKMAKRNKEWVSKYWIGDNVPLYAETFKQIISNHNKLIKKG